MGAAVVSPFQNLHRKEWEGANQGPRVALGTGQRPGPVRRHSPCWSWAPRALGSNSLLLISCWQVSLSWASAPRSSRGMRWGRGLGAGLRAGVGVTETGVPPAPSSSSTAGGTDTARGSEMSRAVGEAGLVGTRGESACGVALGGKAEAGAGGAGLAGGAGSPGVGLLQRNVRGSKSSPRSPSRQRGGLKSSSSPSSSQADVRCEGEPESTPSAAAEDVEEDEEEEEEDEEDEEEDRLSQEPAGAGPTGKASLLECGRRSLCSLCRPTREDRDRSGPEPQGGAGPAAQQNPAAVTRGASRDAWGYLGRAVQAQGDKAWGQPCQAQSKHGHPAGYKPEATRIPHIGLHVVTPTQNTCSWSPALEECVRVSQ